MTLFAEPRRPRRLAFVNARLLDPETGLDARGGLLVRGEEIEAVGPAVRLGQIDDSDVVDARGHLLCPGLIDMRVFTGEPGAEHRETLETACHAAAAGGVTTISVMPDAGEVIDQPAMVDFVLRRARDTARVRVLPVGALTEGLRGEAMAALGLLQEAGAGFVSNGRRAVADALLMRRALTYARAFGLLVDHQPHDPDLVGGGVMNEGEVATRLGLPGIPREAETVMAARDLLLARLTGGRLHLSGLTCADSLDLLRVAKARGLDVTGAATINHLALNENDIGEYRTFTKMMPPLRVEDDRQAMIEGLKDGTLDMLVSAHDPQDPDTKRRPYAEAADGAVGLETLLAAGLRLVDGDGVPLRKLLASLTINPARRLGLPQGRLTKGALADLALIDLGAPWVLDADGLHSRAKNTPFERARLQGRVLRTYVAGRQVFARER